MICYSLFRPLPERGFAGLPEEIYGITLKTTRTEHTLDILIRQREMIPGRFLFPKHIRVVVHFCVTKGIQ